MATELVLSFKHEAIVRSILSSITPENRVLVYGSRAGGAPKPHSDLDLVLLDPPAISESVLARLKMDFEESDLPFRVDVSVWSQLSSSFQEIIMKRFFELKQV